MIIYFDWRKTVTFAVNFVCILVFICDAMYWLNMAKKKTNSPQNAHQM